MASRSRHHLTIDEKNRLRRYHKQHPELTQEQLREWAYETFGQWIARSTVGHIVRASEEMSANPEATRFQSGRYPDMEQELYASIIARGAQMDVDVKRLDRTSHGLMLSDSELWVKANEILKRTRGSDESVSVAWVHRFKKRHGLHRSQLRRAAAAAVDGAIHSSAVSKRVGTDMWQEQEQQPRVEQQEVESAPMRAVEDKKSGTEVTEMGKMKGTADIVKKRSRAAAVAEMEMTETTIESPRKRPRPVVLADAIMAPGARSHFVSSDDILLLTHVLAIKPWTFPYEMEGWQQVMEKLRLDDSFRLEKTAGACQARMNLLLNHLKAENMTVLRKSGTEEEFKTKCALIAKVKTQIEQHTCTFPKGDSKSIVAADSAFRVRRGAAATMSMVDFTQEREHMTQRRLELMERRMEREIAAQKRHSEEQVARLEKLHREQMQLQQEQHAQLLATIEQQQAMMLDLVKSLAPSADLKDKL